MLRLFPLLLVASTASWADLAANQAAYVSQRCGAFFHWNMSTFDAGAVNGWATPNLSVDTFAPAVNGATLAANIDAWAAMVAAAGCKYAYLTAKHVDGFALWPTAYHVSGYPPYSIAQTAWYAANGSPDIVSIFVTACRNHGLNPGLYFGIWDRTMEARNPNCATVGAACYADYMAMIDAQLTELLSNYGGILAVWTDAWGYKYGYTNLPYATIYNRIKELQPNCLLVENGHEGNLNHTDIVAYELPYSGELPFPEGNTNPAEAADTVKWGDSWWFWKPSYSYTASRIRSPRAIAQSTAYYNARQATYLLDFTPDQAGVIPAAEVTAYTGWRAERSYNAKASTGAAVTVSSQYSGTGGPGVLVDGVFATGAISTILNTATTDTTPYAEIDLGAVKSVTRVELFNRTEDGPVQPGRLRDISLTFYDAAHTQVGQVTGINAGNLGHGSYTGDGSYTAGPGQLSVAIGPAVPARYVRISRTRDAGAGTDADRNCLVLMEAIVFAQAGMFPLPGPVAR